MGRLKKTGPRELNGRASRKIRHVKARGQDEMKTGLEARSRHYGVSTEKATDPKYESAIGRWCIAGKITQIQYAAAVKYQSDAFDYSRMISGPKPSGAVDLNRVQGSGTHDPELSAQRDIELKKRMSGALGAVGMVPLTHRVHVYKAIADVVVNDMDLPGQINMVQLGLDVLAIYYGMA